MEKMDELLKIVKGEHYFSKTLGDYITEKEAMKLFGRKKSRMWTLRKNGLISLIPV